MPANQLITKPREEVDLTLTVTDGDVMPYTYHLHDVFSEVISLINQCKSSGDAISFILQDQDFRHYDQGTADASKT